MTALPPLRVAGCDLGKATVRLVVADVRDGRVHVDRAEIRPHGGRPIDALAELYDALAVRHCAAFGATGLYADELCPPALHSLPEDACLDAALGVVDVDRGPLHIVRVGARGYSALVRDAEGRVRHFSSDKCSSGTGETMVKIAGRFGLSIEEADALAVRAAEAIPITARCSVFAKSEMTHFGNQGRPADALFRGYFESIGRYAFALVARARVDGPVYAIGGGARLRSLVAALSEAAGTDVIVPPWAQTAEALGACALAAEHAVARGAVTLPEDVRALWRTKPRRFRALGAPRSYADRVRRLEAPRVPDGAVREPAVLGLDLGSTGSKAVLTSLATGEVVFDAYDRTRGNPVDAARRLIAQVARQQADVRAIGLTGSGREAVATVARAAFGDAVDRIVVENEIVAHATAAIRCDPDRGESLSVVEIGGQDAKFIQIAGGQIVESDMNKACSAGTGSFLEEQAAFYGVHDIHEFTRRAMNADRPPDLGQMCTVFVAEAAGEAQAEGYGVDDLFGGFQYSVIYNYLNRVMGQRTFGRRVFFQGKPASGPSLAWTLAAVTGREVWVPPNPGAMGAWGIGLVALRELGVDALAKAPGLDLSAFVGVDVVGRSEFQCRDKRCATLCTIEKTMVSVRGARKTVVSGGACPKFEVATATRPKLPVDAPSPFDERRAAVDRYAARGGDGPVVGVPAVGALVGYLPWLTTLLAELGLRPRVLEPGAQSLADGEQRCYSFDACAPVKVAHGVVDAEVDRVWFPKLVTLPDRDGGGGKTCPMEQGLPDMVRASLRARGRDVHVVTVALPLGHGWSHPRVAAAVARSAAVLGGSLARVPAALRAAARAQRAYEVELARIGRRALAFARERCVPAVAVCGNLHVIHDPVVNAGIPRVLRENGTIAVPMDCYPLGADVPALERAAWAETRRALRVAVDARRRGDVFPLLITSFGCGPASFGEQVFDDLLRGYPHAVLESDGHGGTAGYVTRVQAFLHSVRKYAGGASPVPFSRVRRLEPLANESLARERDTRFITIAMGDGLSPILAAALRSYGFDAVASGPPDAEALALGRRDCSGKECLPYQLVWGSFRKQLEREPPRRRTALVQVSGDGMCRNCMFSVKDQITLERIGLDDRVTVRHVAQEPWLGPAHFAKVWVGVTAWDILHQLAAYTRAGERDAGAADALYARYCAEVERIMERPGRRGAAGVVDLAQCRREVEALLRDAAGAFARIGADRPSGDGRTVLLSGDIYVRLDAFASDDVARRLAARGLRVIVEPMSVLAEYAASERITDLFGLPTSLVANAVARQQLVSIRRALYAAVTPLHPWLPVVDVRDLRAAARGHVDRYPIGEAPVTVGSVLHHWRRHTCDGVVIASPWGCGPALVSESVLRHLADIPMLFVYCDGSPIDDRRLDAFAFQLRRRPPRAAGGARSRPEPRRRAAVDV